MSLSIQVGKKVSELVPPPEPVHSRFTARIFLICSLNLSLELAKAWFICVHPVYKDVFPPAISNVHVYTTSNYMYSTWLDARHISYGKSLKGAGLSLSWPIAKGAEVLFAYTSGTDIPHFTLNDSSWLCVVTFTQHVLSSLASCWGED